MTKVRVGQVRDLLGKKVAVLHTWGKDQFLIAPLSRKLIRPDQWKTARGQVIHVGLAASETTRWLLDHSKIIGSITKEDADTCWYLFCRDIPDAKPIPTYLTVEQIEQRLLKEWPKESWENLDKAEREWRSFMEVMSPLD